MKYDICSLGNAIVDITFQIETEFQEKLINKENNRVIIKINPKLKYSSFNENVTATTSLKEIRNVKFLFITLPAQNIREVIKDSSLHNKNHHIIICSKGIEISSSKFLTDVFHEMMPFKSISILSGPSFSNEVSQSLPTAVTLATKDKKDFENENRLENIKELLNAMKEFDNLESFLDHVSLSTSIDKEWEGQKVNLMTIHASKGLEFDVVFLPGWEEGLFPHQKSIE